MSNRVQRLRSNQPLKEEFYGGITDALLGTKGFNLKSHFDIYAGLDANGNIGNFDLVSRETLYEEDFILKSTTTFSKEFSFKGFDELIGMSDYYYIEGSEAKMIVKKEDGTQINLVGDSYFNSNTMTIGVSLTEHPDVEDKIIVSELTYERVISYTVVRDARGNITNITS